MWNKVTSVKCPVEPASNKHIGGIIMICVGIDVAKDKHDCFILSSEGEVLADVFTIPNNAEGFRYRRISCPLLPQDLKYAPILH